MNKNNLALGQNGKKNGSPVSPSLLKSSMCGVNNFIDPIKSRYSD